MADTRRPSHRPQEERAGVNEVPRDHYAATIDEHLRSRRGSALGLTASDWSAVEDWWSRGVPLWIITSAIDEVFDRPPAGPLLTRGLRYCAPIIEERFATHLRTIVPVAPSDAQAEQALSTKKGAERMSELLGQARARRAGERGDGGGRPDCGGGPGGARPGRPGGGGTGAARRPGARAGGYRCGPVSARNVSRSSRGRRTRRSRRMPPE